MSNFSVKKIGKKKFSKKLFWGGILAIFLFFAGREIFYFSALKNHFENKSVAILEIEKGEKPAEIAEKLREKKFLAAPKWVFLKYLKSKKLDTKIQSGFFALPKNLTVPELADWLLSASARQTKITILPGATIADIDRLLAAKNLISPGEFEKCVEKCDFSDFPFLPKNPKYREGFFWADTYFIQKDSFSVEKFARRLLKTFDQKTKKLLSGKSRDGFDILKMASIIEKEAGKSLAEKKIIAGILWKRLDAGWPLGADATTRFASKNFHGDLTIDELKNKNPWNTRAALGLPPGAIGAPSLDSIRAAVDPTPTDFWFYLHDQNGKAHFSKTAAEHAAAKKKFLR